MKTVAVTLNSVGGPVQVETLDLSEPLDGEVLVKMGAAGICHSDQHAITGQHGAEIPCVLGHEGAGEVVAVGPNVKKIRIGELDLKPGSAKLQAEVVDARGNEVLRLNRIFLKRIGN